MEVTIKLYDFDIKKLERFRAARIKQYQVWIEEEADDPIEAEKSREQMEWYKQMDYKELVEYFILIQSAQ